MAIKNKDGTPYKPYSSPPPEMETQIFWNETVKVHNKFGKRHTQKDTEVVVKPVVKPVEKVLEPVQKEEIKIVASIEEEKPKYISEGIVDVWCLPCLSYKEHPEYGEKFIFKARIIRSEDLFIQILTKDKIPDHSILYPRINTKRWWEVSGSQETKGLRLIYGIISQYQPSF